MRSEGRAAAEAERVRLAQVRFESLWRALQRVFFAEPEILADDARHHLRREWEYDTLRDPEFGQLWSTTESAILDSEIAEWESFLRLGNPFIALTPGDIAQGNEMAARIGERICLGTAFPSLLLVMVSEGSHKMGRVILCKSFS
jgi:hypothetical protein